jgi:hypothetical protein
VNATEPGAGSSSSSARAALHAPFRPVRGRRSAVALAIGQAVVLVGMAVLMPSGGAVGFGLLDRFGVIVITVAIGALLWRFAQLSLRADEVGLTVRNVIQVRRLEWPQVVSVRFGGGQPWVTLDLADGDTVAVMAIQRADGERGVAEARRLATLVALHSRTERND